MASRFAVTSQAGSILDRPAVHKDDHVSTKRALIVEDVSPGDAVLGEDDIEHFAYGPAVHIARWARYVPLDVFGERDPNHCSAPRTSMDFEYTGRSCQNASRRGRSF